MGSTPNAVRRETALRVVDALRRAARTLVLDRDRDPPAHPRDPAGRRLGVRARAPRPSPGTRRSARSSRSHPRDVVTVTPARRRRTDVGRHRRMARRADRHHVAGRRAVARLRAAADGSRAPRARCSTSWSAPARCARTARSSARGPRRRHQRPPPRRVEPARADRPLPPARRPEPRRHRRAPGRPHRLREPAGLEFVGAHQPRRGARPVDHRLRPPRLARPRPSSASRQLSEDSPVSEPAEATLVRLDGTPWVIESVSVLTRWEGEDAYQVILRDLTDRKRGGSRAALPGEPGRARLRRDHRCRRRAAASRAGTAAAELIYGVTSDVAVGAALHDLVGAARRLRRDAGARHRVDAPPARRRRSCAVRTSVTQILDDSRRTDRLRASCAPTRPNAAAPRTSAARSSNSTAP